MATAVAFQVPIVRVPTDVRDEPNTPDGSVDPVNVLAFAVTVEMPPRDIVVPLIVNDELTN